MVTLIVLSSCQFDSDKYAALLDKSAKSAITELKTPDGFRFDMTECDFDETFAQRESHFTDSLTRYRYGPLIARYDWLIGTEHYAVGKTYSKDF